MSETTSHLTGLFSAIRVLTTRVCHALVALSEDENPDIDFWNGHLYAEVSHFAEIMQEVPAGVQPPDVGLLQILGNEYVTAANEGTEPRIVAFAASFCAQIEIPRGNGWFEGDMGENQWWSPEARANSQAAPSDWEERNVETGLLDPDANASSGDVPEPSNLERATSPAPGSPPHPDADATPRQSKRRRPEDNNAAGDEQHEHADGAGHDNRRQRARDDRGEDRHSEHGGEEGSVRTEEPEDGDGADELEEGGDEQPVDNSATSRRRSRRKAGKMDPEKHVHPAGSVTLIPACSECQHMGWEQHCKRKPDYNGACNLCSSRKTSCSWTKMPNNPDGTAARRGPPSKTSNKTGKPNSKGPVPNATAAPVRPRRKAAQKVKSAAYIDDSEAELEDSAPAVVGKGKGRVREETPATVERPGFSRLASTADADPRLPTTTAAPSVAAGSSGAHSHASQASRDSARWQELIDQNRAEVQDVRQLVDQHALIAKKHTIVLEDAVGDIVRNRKAIQAQRALIEQQSARIEQQDAQLASQATAIATICTHLGIDIGPTELDIGPNDIPQPEEPQGE
ncbi:hypothetical protein DENSPDRAFT_855170 [Dentipellis sp. KUC8613]|nr:hypothetical protein DENSPDRAFT_855170 [Dentipellis sp. KUC8613]